MSDPQGLNCQKYCHLRLKETECKMKGLQTFKILQAESKLRK